METIIIKKENTLRLLRVLILNMFVVLGFNSQGQTLKKEHYVPADKELSKEWKERLFNKGERKVYRGDELHTIGMPCGGVGAGQLYVRGDGTLARWWIFSDLYETTFYKKYPNTNYTTYRPASEIKQGFMIATKDKNGRTFSLPLSQDGFEDVGFIGEYPIATIAYEGAKKQLPVKVTSEVYSPFIPLDTKNSALPATILSYEITNTTDSKIEVGIGGWLQNAAIPKADSTVYARRKNQVINQKNWVGSLLNLERVNGEDGRNDRYAVLDDFENLIARADGTSVAKGDLSKWTIEGEAFGEKAASMEEIGQLGSRDFMWNFKGNQGRHLLFSRLKGVDKTGKVSHVFIVQDDYLSFLIGGNNRSADHKDGQVGVNLLVDGKLLKSVTGENDWAMRQVSWDLKAFKGKQATIEVVDNNKDAALAVDYFVLSNFPMEQGKMFPSNHCSFGDMALAVLDSNGKASAEWDGDSSLKEFLLNAKSQGQSSATAFITDSLCSTVGRTFKLKAGETKKVNFVISWYFPNLKNNAAGCPGDVGRMYDNWFDSSTDVVDYVADNFMYLSEETHQYRDAYYLNSNLPYWFLQRSAASSANMASASIEWWRNGRMYSWEGVGFCHGTCGHVWNYTQTPSRLFPELERSVRKMQDFNVQVAQNESGRINFRGYKDNSESFKNWGYIPDAQAGYVLKAYREHLVSVDNTFLKDLWPNIKLAMEYLMERDGRYGETDGILDGMQHFTDNLGWGPNTFTGSLYLGALRSAEEMAKVMGDDAFAKQCHKLYEMGREWTVNNLWNGEYFIHKYSPAPDDALPAHGKSTEQRRGKSFGDGCLADQVFGQNWAHQLGLDYIYPREYVKSALASVYKYNWAPDVATIYEVMTRRFILLAEEGESGMVGLTFPRQAPPENRPSQNDDPWTGYEYQVASHMLREGMLEEGLSIAYGVHHRYDGVRHNPWNEIEGGDHYTRSMAAWGMLLNISGYAYDGPAGKIGFAPRFTPENFTCFFSGAEGWGSYSQNRLEKQQKSSFELRWGKMKLREISLEIPNDVILKKVKMNVNNKSVDVKIIESGKSLQLVIEAGLELTKGEKIYIVCDWE